MGSKRERTNKKVVMKEAKKSKREPGLWSDADKLGLKRLSDVINVKIGDILIEEDKVTVKMKNLKTDGCQWREDFLQRRFWRGKSAGICCYVGTDSALGRLQGTRLWDTGGVC